MASVFQDAVSEYVAQQPWYVRRKDTLTVLAGMVLQVANLTTAMTTDAPAWVTLTIAAIVGVAQMFVTAGTKGAITPSMGKRIEDMAATMYLDRPSVSEPVVELPVYDGETSSTGKHRKVE